MWKRSLLSGFFILLLLASSQPLRAELLLEGTMEEFRPTVETICKGVAKVLQAKRLSDITVGKISGPPSLGSAVGPGFRQMFIEELQRLNVRVAKLGTEVGLSGEYRVSRGEDNAAQYSLQFEVKLVDSSGQILTDLATNKEIDLPEQLVVNRKSGSIATDSYTSLEAVALAAGLTVDADQVEAVRNQGNFNYNFIDEVKRKPTAHIGQNTTLRASATSPYGLRILVNGQPKRLTLEDNRVFVDLKKEDLFTIQVVNDAAFTVASFFTLDGINSFAFSDVKQDGRPKYTKWITPSKQTFELKGWHKDNNTVRQFKVTDFGESAAALVGNTEQLGTISVVIRATWPFNGQPPPGERAMPGSAAPNSGIGFGAQIGQRVQEDSSAREYGRVRSIMTIHYTHPE